MGKRKAVKGVMRGVPVNQITKANILKAKREETLSKKTKN